MRWLLSIIDCLPLFRVLEASENCVVSKLRRLAFFSKSALLVFLFLVLILACVLPFASTGAWSTDGVQRVCRDRFLRAWSWEDGKVSQPKDIDRSSQHTMFPTHTWNAVSSAVSLLGFFVWLFASPHRFAIAGALDRKRAPPIPSAKTD